jgi:hypothetical protein
LFFSLNHIYTYLSSVSCKAALLFLMDVSQFI